MSHMNMAGINAGGTAIGGMSLINNGTNGATPRAGSDQGDNDFEARLNTHIYDYFIKIENYDCARALLNSHVPMEPPIRRREGDINGTDDTLHADSKDDVDSKRPDDLPGLSDKSNFLLEWYSTFWDFYFARTKNPRATSHAIQYMQATQNRLRAEQHQQHHQMLRGTPGMVPAGLDNYQQMMRFQQANGMANGMINGDLRQKALQNNNRNAFGQPNHQQMAQMKTHQMMQQQQMRRDPSDLDINGQRPRTPSSGDNNAPSPSKRPRLDGIPINGPQMIPNGRGPPPGLQGQQFADSANAMLMTNGIDPLRLSQQQHHAFHQQPSHVQEKSIQVLTNNMRQSQQRQSQSKPSMPGQGSPMIPQAMEMTGDFFPINPQMQMRGGPTASGAGGNHALQDYQMQLMLLEQQNKRRLLMARQEQESTRPEGQPGIPSAQGFAPGMSPSGSRSGPSPSPNDQMKRGTPKMNAASLPGGGSPMPDGSMSRPGGSPAAIPYNNQMAPEMFQQIKMNEGIVAAGLNGMRPPSSHPQYNGQFNSQHMETIRRQQGGQMANGNWPQGPQGQAPMMQQPPQNQPQASVSTPQPRSMPPPTAPPGTTTNGRPASPAPSAAPATPSQSSRPNPKPRKDGKEPRKRPVKKNSSAGAGANPAPATDAENPPQTPVPPTPITPTNSSSFSQPAKNEGQTQPGLMQNVTSVANTAPLAQPQPDAGNIQQFSGLDAPDGDFAMPFTSDMSGDVLENFDFDSFLQGTASEDFSFDPSGLNAYGAPDGVEAGAGDT